MAMFPFAPVAGPGGFPLPPGPGTVLSRIEDAVRETANDVVENIAGGHQASGTNSAVVTSPSGATGTATFDEHVVTVEEYNRGMEGLAKRIGRLAGQVAQIRTGMLTQNGGAQGWDGAMSWDQYQQAQYGNGGGGDMSAMMPLLMMFLLTRNGSTTTGGSSIDPLTLGLLVTLPGLSNGGMGNGANMMMPLLLVTMLKG